MIFPFRPNVAALNKTPERSSLKSPQLRQRLLSAVTEKLETLKKPGLAGVPTVRVAVPVESGFEPLVSVNVPVN